MESGFIQCRAFRGGFRQGYKKHKGRILKVYSIHQRGYSWDDWHVNELTKESCFEYLSTAQYFAMHPLNGQYSHLIDDKLTLKYLCVEHLWISICPNITTKSIGMGK